MVGLAGRRGEGLTLAVPFLIPSRLAGEMEMAGQEDLAALGLGPRGADTSGEVSRVETCLQRGRFG